jgi:hypothetical protein
MSEKQQIRAGCESVDDFKVIRGIGAGVEARMIAAGICTYAQLAAQTPETLAEALMGLVGMTPARVAQKGWIEQAAALVEADVDPEPEETSRQHYETFTVELLVSEEKIIRRTRITRVQDGTQDNWAGFQLEKLVEFIRKNTDLEIGIPVVQAAPVVEEMLLEIDEDLTEPVQAEVASVDMISKGQTQATHMVMQGQPFDVVLKLEVSGAEGIKRDLPYSAWVTARQLGSQKMIEICRVEDVFNVHTGGQLMLKANGLPSGLYRISANLQLGPSEAVTADGSLLQVF